MLYFRGEGRERAWRRKEVLGGAAESVGRRKGVAAEAPGERGGAEGVLVERPRSWRSRGGAG